MLRIALVTQGFADGGGVATIARWLRRELEARGYLVDVFDLASSSRDSRSRRVLSPRTWSTKLVPEESSDDEHHLLCGASWVELEAQRYRPRGALTARLDDYDLVQVVAGAPGLAMATSECRRPVVLQVATTLGLERRAQLPDMAPLKRVVKRAGLPRLVRLEGRALRRVDEVLVENRWMAQWAADHGARRVTLAPPGVNVEVYAPAHQWRHDGPVVAYGRLGDVRKDWGTAISAYEMLVAATGCPQRLVLAGRGPLLPALAERISASPQCDRISVEVDVAADEVPELLASGSVFLQSSLEEGLGLAGLEAMACGLPVVATKTHGSAEYVRDDENGYLTPLGEGAAHGLSRGLAQVLTTGAGPALSARAVETVRSRYSTRATLSAYLETYRRCLSGANA